MSVHVSNKIIIFLVISAIAILLGIFLIAQQNFSSPANSGITGTVLLGPTCPVERIPPDPNCADKPYQARLALTPPDGARVIAEFSSDASGKFRVYASPGQYAIRSAPGAGFYPRCSSGVVTVVAGEFTKEQVSCDTGIR